jgi:hypothetical protein
MSRHTPEQAAILSLLSRLEAVEAENRALNARVSSVVAMLRAERMPRASHLAAVTAGLDAKRVRQ